MNERDLRVERYPPEPKVAHSNPAGRRQNAKAAIGAGKDAFRQWTRLAEILAPIETMDDAISPLGKPDFDDFSTSRISERDDKAPAVQHYRTIRYQRMSDVAEIWIALRPDGIDYWQLHGKPHLNLIEMTRRPFSHSR